MTSVFGDHHARIRKATRGYPCTENKVGRPEHVHTQMVGAAIWASTDRGEDWVQGTRPPDAERVHPEEEGWDEVRTEVAIKPEMVAL